MEEVYIVGASHGSTQADNPSTSQGNSVVIGNYAEQICTMSIQLRLLHVELGCAWTGLEGRGSGLGQASVFGRPMTRSLSKQQN